MTGWMLVDSGEVGLALDAQIVLRWGSSTSRFLAFRACLGKRPDHRNPHEQSRGTECLHAEGTVRRRSCSGFTAADAAVSIPPPRSVGRVAHWARSDQ